MKRAANVKIDVQKVEQYIAKKGWTNIFFSAQMGHGSNWWSGVKIRDNGCVSPNKAKLMATVLGVVYEDILAKEPDSKPPQDVKKDGTVAEYVALISNSLIELAKNQAQVSELMTLTSRQSIDNALYNTETGKLFEVVFQKLNEIGKKVDEIHRELK